jgi:hypothetical protein
MRPAASTTVDHIDQHAVESVSRRLSRFPLCVRRVNNLGGRFTTLLTGVPDQALNAATGGRLM